MKFLLSGAFGFVGSNLCKFLTEHGHSCDALDLPAARRSDLPYHAFFSWDTLNDASSAPDLPSYDAIVHLAGKAHDLRKVASEQNYFDINVGLTQQLFTALRRQSEGQAVTSGRTAFIYFSSSKAAPTGTPYARSKHVAEQWLTDRQATEQSNDPLTILRPAMIHGPGNKGNLNLLWSLARYGLPWPLAAFENKCSFTSIGNVCAVVEALAEKRTCGTFPLADDERISTNRLIELIASECGRPARLWRVPKSLMRLCARLGDILPLPLDSERLAKLTEDSRVDNSALKTALGWNKMPVRAEDGIRLTLKSFGGSL